MLTHSLSNSCQHLANADMITNMKSKIIVSHQHFFADVIFSATSKVQNYQNPYTQTNTCSLHISRNFKDIFKYICFTLYLQKIVNNLERCIVFIDCHCLSCFFFNSYSIQSVQSLFVLIMTQSLFRDIITVYCIEIACQKCFSIFLSIKALVVC